MFIVFCRKLDNLMNITKTTNTSLALFLSVVPSYICRLRNGSRPLPKNSDLLQPMGEFFAEKITDDFQKQSIMQACGMNDTFPEDKAFLATILMHWLSETDVREKTSLETDVDTWKTPKTGCQSVDTLYYGCKGKQDAVVRFLTEILRHEGTQTLLLFSDENMDWMTEPAFFRQWGTLLMRVLQKENHIKIIHTVSRKGQEMDAAIRGWLPLYTTDRIEPYYCPEPKDGIYRRTLFIAPETAAISSFSIQDNIDAAPNLYITDPEAIRAFTKEFEDYISICKPLMQKYSVLSANPAYKTILWEWEETNGTIHLMPEYLSEISFPPGFLNDCCSRVGREDLFAYVQDRAAHILQQLSFCKVYDLLHLPEPGMVLEGKVRIPRVSYPDVPVLWYTPEGFCAHLRQIICLLRTCPAYHAVIHSPEEPYVMQVKERTGAFVLGKIEQPVTYFFNEPQMTASFQSSLRKKIQSNSAVSREDTISLLEGYIQSLTAMM
ncbi:hypothetical protein [Methanocorpusculum vombati]|uniref:Uncharacterized protein n=1 Tax=Methanocorpusculum vombati TaxID=3002864 RepID=A0ABT4IN18_9EURY|nr:hypothetical protein [Methanocorpusculum vombati]MCZ9318778.1 hypothetical protein [Methanocorpusculum sp.]MCZ0862515.1 hypothetical protein [Methanocorpusculum vombati]MDE2521420.1 hypothetical protein [Methanocorpusculum sp.]MDE2533906.1 hypothetical protein [Methanocorpusculum sp.]MDE2546759.1 hypothetical protein [Methanocorpusculum sp.]